MSLEKPPHRIDRILALLVPDPRKRIAGVPTVNPRTIPENHPLMIELIEGGFMEGRVEDGVPRVSAVTWKGLDFYNACRGENIRIRLRFRCNETATVEQAYTLAVELHAAYGQERQRYSKRYR